MVTSRMETASEPLGEPFGEPLGAAAVPLLLPFNSALWSFGYLYGAQRTPFRQFGTEGNAGPPVAWWRAGEGTPVFTPSPRPVRAAKPHVADPAETRAGFCSR